MLTGPREKKNPLVKPRAPQPAKPQLDGDLEKCGENLDLHESTQEMSLQTTPTTCAL
jgi:hypothetical protein